MRKALLDFGEFLVNVSSLDLDFWLSRPDSVVSDPWTFQPSFWHDELLAGNICFQEARVHTGGLSLSCPKYRLPNRDRLLAVTSIIVIDCQRNHQINSRQLS
jgi:hypothetical protein